MNARLVLVVAIMSLLPGVHDTGAQAPAAEPARPRVAIFFEPGFPAVDAPAVDVDGLRRALPAFDITTCDMPALQATLDGSRVDVLVLPFGSAFPRDAWPSIFRFLSAGGSLVNLGGVPFAAPVGRAADAWSAPSRSVSYHKQLGIVQAFAVPASRLAFRAVDPDDQAAQALAAGLRARSVFELIVRLASAKTFPDEDGSDGPREARLTPLVHGFEDPTGRRVDPLPVAAPFVQIDRLDGAFAGGRWLFATGDSGVSPQAAAALVARAAQGGSELRVQPRYAGFHPGEPIEVTVSLRRPGTRDAGESVPSRTDIEIFDDNGHAIATTSAPLIAAGTLASAHLTVPVDSTSLRRGLYRLRATVRPAPLALEATSGFWIYDSAMLSGGHALATGRDYFTRDGKPFPIAGTTYMASDVHRRFLLEPNPWMWQRDFASMAQAGVNLVRTGIWTGWSEHSGADGQPSEVVLRSLDVFLLTARGHDIPVIFTLFAFVPPAWGGGSPYFDARSLAAQQRFAGVMAARLAGANDIAWDLINEPSFSSAERLWQCRPSYDTDEQAAWEAWLRADANAGDDREREARLADRWNAVAGEGLALPALPDFRDANLFGLARPNKAADYKRFAQEAFARWLRGVNGAIRASGNRAQLITVGQDEGGAGERPNPLLFGADVDFTGTHTWWNNDALLWDALMAKRPDRPALVEETGLMTYERPDGSPWRTEENARNLLERKIALAIASGGAGFVQWLWNTNVYMPVDNEAGIGFLRADGTAKPELEPFAEAASFLHTHRDAFAGRELEDVAVVVPQSSVFSVRDQGTPATQRAVRSFEYDLRVPVRVVNEYATDDLRRGARLLAVPSPRILTQAAWEALLAAADAGSTVLITGPVDRDEYERPIERLARTLGIRATTVPVAPENALQVDGKTVVPVPFRGGKLERIERALVNPAEPARVQVLKRGEGRIVWCPLPVELSDDPRATSAVYRLALRLARIRPSVRVPPAGQGGRLSSLAGHGILLRPLRFAGSILLVAVNETNADADLQVQIAGIASPVRVRVRSERATMVLVDKTTGKLLGRLTTSESMPTLR